MNTNQDSHDAAAGHQPPPPPVAPTRAASPLWDPRAKSPALACALSAIPGLGQIYVGYYRRGFVHALTVATLFTLLVGEVLGETMLPLMVVFLVFFWLYNIIDAGRRASLFNQALAGGKPVELPTDLEMPGMGGSIIGGGLLVVGSFVLLLHTRFDLSMAWLADWWPAAGIAFGLYLLVRGILDRSANNAG